MYRLRQFIGGLTARVSEADRREADEVLPRDARAWFRSLPRDAQWHGLNVMRDLQRAGYDQPEVLAAALLHDAGKIEAAHGPLVRALMVLARKFAPDWLARRARLDWRSARGLNRVAAVAAQHPQIAAERAAQCGCDPITIDLIRRHQDKAATQDDWLRALQQVDDRN
ncbi:MAG: hypothetical protein HY870_18465 [Chloroflexi bacterium]|nr:hypothetical protein [Chloroflexota bacterium]